ncbi:MAG: NAD(P)/FAD-dependent oxidoreductase [Victivallales bacterium]
MKNKFDIIVIGAGVVGAAIARELSRYQLKVAVIEKEEDVSFGTSKANSGIVHAGFHSQPGTLKLKLEADGNRMFDKLFSELGFPFERRGELMVAFSEDELQILHKYYQRAVQNEISGVELLGRERTLELEPNLNPDILGSLHAPTAGIVGPYEYCFALIENAKANGVKIFLDNKVKKIFRKGAFLEIVTDKGISLSGKFIVNAAGIYSDEIAKLAGVGGFKILPRKGEEYLLDRRVGGLVRRVIFPVPSEKSKGLLVIPTVDGPVMVGPTAEDIESRTDFSTTRSGLEAVFKNAQKMVPAIRATDIITSFVGLRPAATGGDFIIGKTSVKGFINAAGIQSPGLTASPAIAEMIRNILVDGGLQLKKKDNFCPNRTAVPKIRPLVESRDYAMIEKLIAQDKNYSKLVCRCENITEAEIIAAVRSGHTTLDGIKFAARACTGRCQGGFCTSRILDIIHRETGIPIEKISKKGKGSEVLLFKK